MTRPVTVFEWVLSEADRKQVSVKQFKYSGTFHAFSTDYEEFDEGPGNFPVAIVENKNGEVEPVPIGLIRFEDKPKP